MTEIGIKPLLCDGIADRAAKECIFILDEVLTPAQRKDRWTVKNSKVSDLEKEEEDHQEHCKKE